MRRTTFVIGAVLAVSAAGVGACLPAIGAGALLHPSRRVLLPPAPAQCKDASFAGAGVTLRGWRCHSAQQPRGTIVYLHGIADNRGSALGTIQRYSARGFDVIAYDSRAHGESGGSACTYGFFEKQDLRRVVDTISNGPVILIGTSLGGAVALQEAATDPRIAAVVAAEPFSDLRTVATDRAPRIFTRGAIEGAFARAEAEGRFSIDAVSPEIAARQITVPVLLIHGAADSDTLPAHSERIRRALRGPAELILVPRAGHNQSLTGDIWQRIDQWIERAIATAAGT